MKGVHYYAGSMYETDPGYYREGWQALDSYAGEIEGVYDDLVYYGNGHLCFTGVQARGHSRGRA